MLFLCSLCAVEKARYRGRERVEVGAEERWEDGPTDEAGDYAKEGGERGGKGKGREWRRRERAGGNESRAEKKIRRGSRKGRYNEGRQMPPFMYWVPVLLQWFSGMFTWRLLGRDQISDQRKRGCVALLLAGGSKIPKIRTRTLLKWPLKTNAHQSVSNMIHAVWFTRDGF